MDLGIDISQQLFPNPLTMLYTLCVTAVLFFFIYKFLFNPAREMIQKREDYVNGKLKDADNINLEAKENLSKAKEEVEKAKELSKKIVPLLNLQKGNLELELGTEDAAFTAIASSIVSIFIAVALPYVADVEKYKNYNYKITPIYLNKNVFFLQFSCIITIKLLHIIKVMCKKDKKGK